MQGGLAEHRRRQFSQLRLQFAQADDISLKAGERLVRIDRHVGDQQGIEPGRAESLPGVPQGGLGDSLTPSVDLLRHGGGQIGQEIGEFVGINDDR